MSKENKNHQDEFNENSYKDGDSAGSQGRNTCSNDNNESKTTTTTSEGAPKESNPFSFKHFLKDTSNSNVINGNETGISNGITSSSITSSLNSSATGARPKIPQFQPSSSLHNQADSRMKRSPKFSSFDSQSSLSELADERNMHGSRSNNCFNLDYQFPSSRSYSNYDIEPNSSSLVDRKLHQGRRSQTNVNNTSNSILPDFVQDHLLMESYYDHNETNMSPLSNDNFNLDSDAHSRENGHKISRNLSSDPPFELSYNRSPNTNRRRGNQGIPLDLPSERHRPMPSDLPPCDLMDGAGADVAVQREETYGPHNEPEITRDQAAIDKMQTLPDFLSDGPIYSGRIADVANIVDEDNQSIILRLQQENERLRQDIDESRRVILDLEQQINHAKNMETQYNVTLAESMEQVEENLFASNQRAAEAEAQASKYKQQVKQLSMEIQNLRRENEALREGGAVGGIPLNPNNNNRRFIARDLRLAASSAENNLRQLLIGVENLRAIANTIEDPNQFVSTNSDYLSDDSDDNEGPAL